MVRTFDQAESMHPADIKARLERAGYHQSDVARLCGVSPATIGEVIHGRTRSREIERRLAILLGREPKEIWPTWYCEDGKPLRRRRTPVRIGEALSRAASASSKS